MYTCVLYGLKSRHTRLIVWLYMLDKVSAYDGDIREPGATN